MGPRTMIATAVLLAATPLMAERPGTRQVDGAGAAIAGAATRELSNQGHDPVQSMRRSLLDLASKQEIRYASTRRYSSDLSELAYQPQAGVAVKILAADGNGWSGSATHAEASGRSCVVYFGKASPPTTAGGTRAARAAAITCD